MTPDDVLRNADRGAVAALETAAGKDVEADSGWPDNVRGDKGGGRVIIAGDAGG